ncbi:MAG: non-canonical purine NTP pyrophosphatase, partial [Saccharofermentanales bacterium]
PEYHMTTASMSREMKNSISHRGIALRRMTEILKKSIE